MDTADLGDYIRVGIGDDAAYPASFQATLAAGLVIPDLPPGTACYGTPDILVSDHCATLTKFSPAPTADALRGVTVDGPSRAGAGAAYRLSALVTGGGGHPLAYRWDPGGATTAALDAVAGAAGTTQSWKVFVTDQVTGSSVTALHQVAAFRDNRACLDACDSGRDACMANDTGSAGAGGGINVHACVQAFNQCTARCGR